MFFITFVVFIWKPEPAKWEWGHSAMSLDDSKI